MFKTLNYAFNLLASTVAIITASSINADEFNPFNIINPNNWFDEQRSSYYHHYDKPLSPPAPPLYGVPYVVPYNGYPVPYGGPPLPGYWSGYTTPPPIATPLAPQYPATAAPTSSLSKDEMANRIKELEARLEAMEIKNRHTIVAPKTATSSSNYSKDQIFNETTSQYPFRPLELER